MLTARGEEEDRVRGLETVRMTISPSRFLRRSWWRESKGNAPYFANGGGRGDRDAGANLDPTSHRVMAGEEPLEMGPKNLNCCTFL